MAWIYGTNFTDVLNGTLQNDVIMGFAGNDTLKGKDGNDWIYGGFGLDSLKGGNGDDVLFGQDQNDTLSGGDGQDFLNGGNHNDKLYGGKGHDTLIGGAGEDTIDGWKGIDTVDYADSTSTVLVYLGNGFGLSHAAPGASILSGDEDVLYGIENIIGSKHNDWLKGHGGDNTIQGGDGNDRIEGLDGHDDLFGEDGDDELWGDQGNDWIAPGNGNASVYGGPGIDTLDMRVQGDTGGWTIDLAAESGSRLKPIFKVAKTETDTSGGSQKYAKTAQETLLVEEKQPLEQHTLPNAHLKTEGLWPFVDLPDRFRTPDEEWEAKGETGPLGFPGFEDKPDLEGFDPKQPGNGSFTPIEVAWKIQIYDIENLVGSHGNDKLYGNALNNDIYSSLGNDKMFGRGGDDFLYSNAGSDTMFGNGGEDTLVASDYSDFVEMTGGNGADEFQFSFSHVSNPGLRGAIKDFSHGDTIVIHDFLNFAGPPDFIGDTPFSGTGREVRVSQLFSSPFATVEMDSDGDGQADWTIEVTKTNPYDMLDLGDFSIL